MRKSISKKITIMIALAIVVALSALLVISGQCYCIAETVKAETSYSSVLDDLTKDSDFSTSNYPIVENDYSLNIIQLAESTDKELFVYVYQPSGKAKDLTASTINISVTINDAISFVNYKLELLSKLSVFYKYKVVGLTVSTLSTRYYAISSIYRPFDKTIDKSADFGNTVTEVNYNVSKQYCFSTINGNPYVQVVDIETITITDKFVGFARYKDGYQLHVGACDSHFVAFNTDKPIDKLLEADVYYTQQSAAERRGIGATKGWTFGEKSDEYAYLKYTDKVEHTGDGWFAGTYKWDRIETVEQFIAENDITQNVYSGAIIDINVANKITDEGKAALKGKKWVLRFVETEYSLSYNSTVGVTSEFLTLIGDVTILRLKFETDGITYNLGVIDNKQSGSNKPINKEETQVTINERGKTLLLLVLLVILLIILAPLLPSIISLLIWVISLPFKLLSWIFKQFKKKKTKQ